MSPTPSNPGRPGSPAPVPQSAGGPEAGAASPEGSAGYGAAGYGYGGYGAGGYGPPGGAGPAMAGRGYPPRPPFDYGRPPRRWFARLGWLAFFVALVVIWNMRSSYQSYFQTGASNVEEHYYSLSTTSENKVAVIDVEGLILHQDGFAKWQIEHALADPNVKAVVLRVDSPGGTVTGSNYIYHQLVELAQKRNIKLVVSMGGICASGGYYISMAVGDTPDSVFAEPTTWTGSIGVVIPHYDLSGLLEKWNVTDDSIVSNPLKLTGSMTNKPSPEVAAKERKILQELVDDSFHDFKEIVKSGRPKFRADGAALDAVATGQVFTAKQAQQNGLVDKIGYLDDAIDQAIALNKLDKSDVRVVKYNKPKGLFDDVLGGSLGESKVGGLSMSGILELATPRAYFVWTSLPGLMASEAKH